MIALGLFSILDYLIYTMPYETADATMIVSMMRSTLAVKRLLPSWDQIAISVYNERDEDSLKRLREYAYD